MTIAKILAVAALFLGVWSIGSCIYETKAILKMCDEIHKECDEIHKECDEIHKEATAQKKGDDK